MPRAGAAARPYPGAAPWRPRDRAAYFATKASDYISFADPPRVVDNSTDYCIEIVVRVRTATTSWDTPFSKQAAITNGLYFSANVVGSGFDFYVNDTPQGFSFPGVTVGQARYYCVNYVNATLYGFTAPYDGSATQSLSNAGTAFPAAATTTNEPIQIGACSAQGSGFAGEVLWVRWWNKGLDNDTLARIWNRRFIPGARPPRDLAFWWDAASPLRDLVSGQIGTVTGTVALSNGYAYPPYVINTRDKIWNLPLTSIAGGAGALTLTPSPVAVPVTPVAVSLAHAKTLTPSPVAVPVAPVAPSMDRSLTLTPSPVAVPVTPVAVSITSGTAITPDPVAIPVVPVAVALAHAKTLAPDPVAVPVTPVAVSVSMGGVLSPDPVAVPVTPVAVSLAHAKTLTPSPVAVPVAPVAPALSHAKTLTPSPVAVPVAPVAPSMDRSLALAPAPVAVVVVPVAPTLLVPRVLAPSPVAVVVVLPELTLLGILSGIKVALDLDGDRLVAVSLDGDRRVTIDLDGYRTLSPDLEEP